MTCHAATKFTRLRLKYDSLLPSLAFNLRSRHYDTAYAILTNDKMLTWIEKLRTGVPLVPMLVGGQDYINAQDELSAGPVRSRSKRSFSNTFAYRYARFLSCRPPCDAPNPCSG